MRIFMKTVFGILPMTLLGAPVALAAQPSWKHECVGPEHVCSSVKGEAASNTTTVSKAKPKTAKLKSAKPAAVASELDKPSKVAKKKIAKAKPQDDEADTPVKKVQSKKKVIAKTKPQNDDEDDQPAKKSVAKKKVIAKAKPQDDDEDAKPAKKVASKKSKGGDGGGSVYETGVASWYGGNFNGRKTANGETYDMWAMTAAHKSLPFGTVVKVTNTKNGDSTVVRINDRGPFVGGRVIDLSRAAANDINLDGLANVKLTILGKG